jgi:hypothetical protein
MEEMNILPMFDDDSNLDVEIRIFARNVKREVIGVIDYFFSQQNMIRKFKV